jgi:hypothetical protein
MRYSVSSLLFLAWEVVGRRGEGVLNVEEVKLGWDFSFA